MQGRTNRHKTHTTLNTAAETQNQPTTTSNYPSTSQTHQHNSKPTILEIGNMYTTHTGGRLHIWVQGNNLEVRLSHQRDDWPLKKKHFACRRCCGEVDGVGLRDSKIGDARLGDSSRQLCLLTQAT